MASYDEARANEFTAATTKTITGVALEAPEESRMISGVGRIPIRYCVCVTEPCECDGPVIWVEEADLREKVATDRRSRTGEELHDFKIDRDATVLIESIVPARAGNLGRHHAFGLNPSSHLPRKAGCGCDGEGGATTVLRANAPGAYYDGQDCGGHTLYDVWVEADGLNTTFYYIAVGSC